MSNEKNKLVVSNKMDNFKNQYYDNSKKFEEWDNHRKWPGHYEVPYKPVKPQKNNFPDPWDKYDSYDESSDTEADAFYKSKKFDESSDLTVKNLIKQLLKKVEELTKEVEALKKEIKSMDTKEITRQMEQM